MLKVTQLSFDQSLGPKSVYLAVRFLPDEHHTMWKPMIDGTLEAQSCQVENKYH